jgi:hypothetical protein
MPITTDPNIVKATVALKRSQTLLTTLRRRHLEGDYISKTVFESFVLALAADLRRELLTLPSLVRRAVSETVIRDKWQLEDAIERAVDGWMLAYSKRPLPDLPKPVRSKSAYTSKPGPRPGTRKPKVNGAPMEAAL